MINSYIFERNRDLMRQPIFVLLILLIVPLSVSAQYTDMINTNRPGVSQGAFSVGKKVFQFETGISLGKEEHRLRQTETSGMAIDYALRYGFFKEELEVSVIGIYQRDQVTDTRGATNTEFTQSNFKSNTVGVKYLIYDPYRKKVLEKPNLLSWKANNKFQWADLIPAVSVYAGANFDFADNPFTPEAESSISPKLILATQNNFIGGFVLVTNIIADRVTTDFPSYGYIVTLTHATNDYFSIFVENQGFKSDFYADQILRAGAAVLINKDFHVDLSLSLNFKDTPSLFYGRVGAAYRFDFHAQDEFIEEKGKAGREAKREEKQKNKDLKKKKKQLKKDKKRKDSIDLEDVEDDGGR